MSHITRCQVTNYQFLVSIEILSCNVIKSYDFPIPLLITFLLQQACCSHSDFEWQAYFKLILINLTKAIGAVRPNQRIYIAEGKKSRTTVGY